MQNMYISYLRGYEGKPRKGYGHIESLIQKKWTEGRYDRKNKLPNRYLNK